MENAGCWESVLDLRFHEKLTAVRRVIRFVQLQHSTIYVIKAFTLIEIKILQ